MNKPLDIQPSKGALWSGRVMTGLVIAFLLFDALIKLPPIQPVTDTLQALGFSASDAMARGLGVLLLACTALYAMPRTALLGAILLTGYLGGAIAIQLRAGSPVFSHLLFGVYVGVLMWTGLLLRDRSARRALFS